MKKLLSIVSIILLFLAGCGSSGEKKPDTSNAPRVENGIQDLSKIHNDSILVKVANTNFANLIVESKALSSENYVALYKRIHALRFSGLPDLNTTFSLKGTAPKTSRNQKVIYQDDWKLQEEHNCKIGGTVYKDVSLIARGTLDANTYKTGDHTKYVYNKCDMGTFQYDGKVEYSVGNSNSGVKDIYFDYTFGAIPLGTFTSEFRNLSIETDTQKVILNGTIEYNAVATYTPEPNKKLKTLLIHYSTVGDFIVTVYDKTTGETTTFTYNGTLFALHYMKNNTQATSNNNYTDVKNISTDFHYYHYRDYRLHVKNNLDEVTISVTDNIRGIVGAGGKLLPRGTYLTNDSSYNLISISEASIYHFILVDGTSRYILDKNTDAYPDDIRVDEASIPLQQLPKSDVDLMKGVVVIGFDTCPFTTRVLKNLSELGIDYKYIDIEASKENNDVLTWLNGFAVPYVGINGFYYLHLFDKNTTAVFLNKNGYDMNDTLVKNGREKSVSIKLEEWNETLKTKPTHTALAVAVDTPTFFYQAAWVWGSNTAEEARIKVLNDCEKLKKERIKNNKSKIYSKCKIYSIDGVKQ